MFTTITRLLLYFAPFIKEVFINSTEDKRIWAGRMAIIAVIAFLMAYLVVDHIEDKLQSFERENTYLRQSNTTLLKEVSGLEARLYILDRSLSEKQSNFESVENNYRTLLVRIDKLREENNVLQKDLFRLQHSLSSECKERLSDIFPKEEDIPKEDKDRSHDRIEGMQ